MTRFKINRRHLLRGAGGLCLGLPLLEAMFDHKTALAGAPPLRYIVVFGGVSISSEQGGNFVVPDSAGPLTAPLKTALAPLEPFKSELSIVSGLSIPAGNGAGSIPAGGRYGRASFHDESVGPLLSGMRSPSNDSNWAQGVSSDYVVAQQLGGATAISQLALRVQAANYGGHLVPLSYNDDADPIDPYSSPQGLFDTLFGSTFVPPGEDSEPDPAAELARAKQASVIDLVRGDTNRLVARVGAQDRQRLEAHLEGLDTLYKKITATSPTPVTNSCSKPAAPPSLEVGGSYSGEDARAEVFVDLLHMALACDLTRVATIAVSEPMSMMVVPADVTGIPSGENKDLHELGHSSTSQNHARGFAWHTKHLARLLDKLKNTPDVTGTFLDNTVVVFLTEGGSGQGAPHNTEGMSVIVAGGKGRIRQGEHIVATGKHPVNVTVSAMNAVGVSASGLGEVQGNIPDLLV
ncbi:MAG: DUF1552 domain-containing protein [Polyangiaceae bacterium]|nr:DUF1552 domain-containing protein [Polyangiaceae bacterium]